MGIFSRLKFHPAEMSPAWSATVPGPESHIRAMWPGDLEQVLIIERLSFPDEYAWQSADFNRCFAMESRNLGYVVELAGRLVAYAVVYACAPHALLLDNLAVLPAFRRMGLAKRVLAEIEKPNSFSRPMRMRAVVRECNLPAQLTLRAAGWRAVGMSRQPWPDCDEDGIRFFKRLISHKH